MEIHEARQPRNPMPPTPPATPGVDVEIGHLGFKGVGFVKIMASPELDTEAALAMTEQVISMMRVALGKVYPVPHS